VIKQFRNPVFDLGVLSVILFLAGVFILNTNGQYGYIILFIATGAAILFTLITIIELLRSKTLKGQKKVLWMMIVFLVPVLGSFMYYIFSSDNEKPTIV
jgi:NADH:ubiquinone oxidoreductase subunit 6 (subunit J)